MPGRPESSHDGQYGVRGSPLLPTYRFLEKSSPFLAKLFQEALALLMRKPEAALAQAPSGAHVTLWGRRGPTQLGGPKGRQEGSSSPGSTPTEAWKSHSISRSLFPP